MSVTEPQVPDKGKFNATQTAKALGVCRKSLYNYRAQGRIRDKMSRTGRSYYFGAEIKRFWREN